MVMTDPTQSMVGPKQMYSTLSDFIDLNGLGDPDQYFLDPESPEGQQMAQQKMQQQQQQQQQMMQEQQTQLQMQQMALDAQQKVAQAEQVKAQATLQNGQLKAQIDAMKAQHQLEVDGMKNQISAAKEAGQQRFNVQKLQTDTAIKLTELELQAKRELNKDVQDNQGALNGEGGSAKGSEKRASGES
jgi:multidrug efflux pump subunit AcrA (membrane-fusion protein)